MKDDGTKKVTRRRVFYIPGYDPIHPRRYRELYRTESAAQAEISGYRIKQRKGAGGPYGWQVAALIDKTATISEIEVMLWSDLVRKSMSATVFGTYMALIQTAWIYLSSGTLRRLMWLRKGPIIAALYPVGMLVAQLLASIALAFAGGSLIGGALSWLIGLFARIGLPGIANWGGWTVIVSAISLAFTFAAIVVLLRFFRSLDRRIFAYYLMHDYAYSAKLRGAYPPELEERIKAFGDTIAAALVTDADEVLIVGHSSGAHLAVSILADLIRAGRVPANGPAVSLLSLGQVIPMISFLPDAHRLRRDLQFLSMRDEITWVDVSAPGDGCAFALCDPVAVSGVAQDDKRWPLVISAAFSQSLAPETWQKLRWRFFRLHFQYLCAFDRPRDYDYFQITAGPMTLADRYADRKPSVSRIDVAASRFTSIAA